jgi:predicted phage-related endonuclease
LNHSADAKNRRYFIGGSDARIIMGNDEAALLRLWREKRGEVAPEDLSGNLVVELGVATEDLNRRWYQTNTGQVLTDVQCQIRHPTLRWMAATLDGRVEATGAVFEAKFMLPWSFSEQAAAEKYMPQKAKLTVQHAIKKTASTAARGNQFNRLQLIIARRCVRSGQRFSPKHRPLCASN